MDDIGRVHDVSGMTAGELERARRDLQVSLSLAWPGSPVAVPIRSHMDAIEAELAGRGYRLCGCGFGTDDLGLFLAHGLRYPDHDERNRAW
jgi:hypothetical protein